MSKKTDKTFDELEDDYINSVTAIMNRVMYQCEMLKTKARSKKFHLTDMEKSDILGCLTNEFDAVKNALYPRASEVIQKTGFEFSE